MEAAVVFDGDTVGRSFADVIFVVAVVAFQQLFLRNANIVR
jgi:hypothetical protein